MPTIAQRVKALRGRKGWSAEELGNALQGEGVKWDRFTVANLEKGKRQNVTVVELLALAKVLDAAVVNLLVPLTDEPYQVTPALAESADVVREWVRGTKPLPGTDTEAQRTFYAEVAMADIKSRGHIVPLGIAYDDTPQRGPSVEHREAPER
ncbi:helix-turn-helix domain-containing protein [Streptomyces parvulus]|uniref:helix-turn-helix domain-containing protein n=1 Tax=Streptomyces parvulus TaxID=146923 RepID=UPI00340D64BF